MVPLGRKAVFHGLSSFVRTSVCGSTGAAGCGTGAVARATSARGTAASTNRLLVCLLSWVRSSPSEQAEGWRCYACDSLAVKGALQCEKASPAVWSLPTDALQQPPKCGTAARAGIAAFTRDGAPIATEFAARPMALGCTPTRAMRAMRSTPSMSAGFLLPASRVVPAPATRRPRHFAATQDPSATLAASTMVGADGPFAARARSARRGAAGSVPVAFLRMPNRQGYATSCAEFRGDYRDDASSLATIPSSSASPESARCCDAAQADDEIVARWAEPGLAPLFEALWMLSCWPRESLRQNGCKRLRQRSDGLRIAFG